LTNNLKTIDMGLIKEPLEVDFVVDPKSMTKEDKKAISHFIKSDKLKRAKAKSAKSKPTKTKRKGSKTKV
jgi:hypothetical protein